VAIFWNWASAARGPFDLIYEATGFSPLVFEAMEVLGKNGVLVLANVTGGDRTVEVPADCINLGFVVGNKVTSRPNGTTEPWAAARCSTSPCAAR
jgi:threonine dehydrogenase-like Zn-dependent dehydrogenase